MAGQNDEVLRALGRLEESVRLLREDFQEEKSAARESRAAIHSRLDRQQDDLSHLETTVVLSGQTVAQQRDVIVGLKETVEKDIRPTIDEVKDIKRLGKTASFIFVSLGFTAGGVFFTFWDSVRPWLGKILMR